MKMQDLEKRIEAKANENVQKKIQVFMRAIDMALCQLMGLDYMRRFGEYAERLRNSCDKDSRELFGAMTSCLELAVDEKDANGKKKGWPKLLWNQEVELLRSELLAKMDLMQQLIMCNTGSSEDDIKPAE